MRKLILAFSFLSVRLLAGAGVGAVVKVDWILTVERANWANIGCTFEVDLCGWSSGFENQKNQWGTVRGQTATSETGPPEGAFEGDWCIYTEASATFNEAGLWRAFARYNYVCAYIQFTDAWPGLELRGVKC